MTEGTATPMTLKDLKGFFGYEKLTDFSKDWKALDEADRKAIRAGIEDGSMTY